MTTAALGLTILPAGDLAAQGAVFGVVRDTSGAPVADVEMLLQPAARRVRSDFAGRYAFEDVGNGAYTVFARKLGYAPEQWEARISAKGRIEVNITMRRRTDLDTIRVVAKCDGLGVVGFECRKRAAGHGALFFDYPDIDAFGEYYVADIFRHIPGFAVTNQVDRQNGHVFPVVHVLPKPYKCLSTFVDGRALSSAFYGVPRLTKDLVALELYPHIDSVPITNPKYMWVQNASAYATRRCGVLMYWTVRAPIEPPRASKAPPPKQLRVNN